MLGKSLDIGPIFFLKDEKRQIEACPSQQKGSSKRNKKLTDKKNGACKYDKHKKKAGQGRFGTGALQPQRQTGNEGLFFKDLLQVRNIAEMVLPANRC